LTDRSSQAQVAPSVLPSLRAKPVMEAMGMG
jgi:hypothetical protein